MEAMISRTHRLIALGSAALLTACTSQAPREVVAPLVYATPAYNDVGSVVHVLSGSLRPRVETELAFRVGGKVNARLVEIGQTVVAGQVLARLDTVDLQLAVTAAQAALSAAQVDAQQAAMDADRFKRLLADGSVGTADQERLQAKADAAAARELQAQSQRNLQRNRAAYTSLLAPFGGVVTGLHFEVGQTVAEGQRVVGLAKQGELELVVDIPELLAPQLHQHSASAQIVGSDVPIALKLRELAPAASTQTRTFRARFSLATQHADSRIGNTASVRLVMSANKVSTELPASALLRAGGPPGVWLADASTGALTRQPVELLAQTTNHVRVAGVPDGALVVAVGAQKLDPGMTVRVATRPLKQVADAVEPVVKTDATHSPTPQGARP